MARANTNHPPRLHVPAWGRSLFSPDEYADFTRLVSSEIDRLRLPVDVDFLRGQAAMQQSDFTGKVSFVALARLCKARPRSEWPEQIADFLKGIRKTYADRYSILDQIARFEAARPVAKVRLHPEAMMRHPDAPQLVLRKIADGIAALLVCDLGFANISVPASIAQGWGVPYHELFEIAKQNVRAEGPLAATCAAPFGIQIDLLVGESHYGASHVLFFEDYLKDGTGYGAIVGVPQRHVLVRHVIRDDSLLDAVRVVQAVIDDWFAEGPGQISRDLYWWRRGKLARIDVKRSRGALLITPSEEFDRVVLQSILRGN